MRIGVPDEIKNHEYRVGLIPTAVSELARHGHQVFVQQQAGAGVGFSDDDYLAAGASIAVDADEVFSESELIVKVKEPESIERAKLSADQTLFAYLHLAPDMAQTQDLLRSGATCIAYETVTDGAGRLPLLAPMSEVAGRMSIQAGAMCLEKSRGGCGVLLGGVPGVAQAQVLILGGGVVGQNAAQMAVGMGACVTILDKSIDVLRRLDQLFGSRVQTLYASHDVIELRALAADLIIGAVLVPGAHAPKLISADLVSRLQAGTVMVDVAIDQGGCFETSYATTHAEPTYMVGDVVHYCVANMPGGVARTSTIALNNATLPYVIELADKGVKHALLDNAHLLNGLNVYAGNVTNASVGAAHQLPYAEAARLLAA